MKLTEVLDKRCIQLPLTATDPTAVITQLVDLLFEHGKITDRDAVLQAVLARERARSTGLGDGLAIPHGTSSGCAQLAMAAGRLTKPLNFGAMDGQPCEFVVLLVDAAGQSSPHIQALAGVTRLWLNKKFREEALLARTPEELYAMIERHEPGKERETTSPSVLEQ